MSSWLCVCVCVLCCVSVRALCVFACCVCCGLCVRALCVFVGCLCACAVSVCVVCACVCVCKRKKEREREREETEMPPPPILSLSPTHAAHTCYNLSTSTYAHLGHVQVLGVQTRARGAGSVVHQLVHQRGQHLHLRMRVA